MYLSLMLTLELQCSDGKSCDVAKLSNHQVQILSLYSFACIIVSNNVHLFRLSECLAAKIHETTLLTVYR